MLENILMYMYQGFDLMIDAFTAYTQYKYDRNRFLLQM